MSKLGGPRLDAAYSARERAPSVRGDQRPIPARRAARNSRMSAGAR
jgi:hypothetical protein